MEKKLQNIAHSNLVFSKSGSFVEVDYSLTRPTKKFSKRTIKLQKYKYKKYKEQKSRYKLRRQTNSTIFYVFLKNAWYKKLL